jgi:hypothetical protein
VAAQLAASQEGLNSVSKKENMKAGGHIEDFVADVRIIFKWSRDSVVGISTGYGLDERGVGVRVLSGS